jgi:hypothetical protein
MIPFSAMNPRGLFLARAAIFPGLPQAELRLAAIFGDHLVLQQKQAEP